MAGCQSQRLRFAGVESTFIWQPRKSQTVRISWTALHGAQNALNGLQSEYIFNYPVQNIHASWSIALGRAFGSAIGAACPALPADGLPGLERQLTQTRQAPPLLRLSNLSNTGYQEITGVAMPGRSITGGFAFQLGR